MKAFVTGGSGFLGGALIRALRGRGDDVVALARSEAAAQRVRQAGADEITRSDLSRPEALRQGMEGCDCVFHAAGLVAQWGDPEDFTRVHVAGTRNALDAAQAAGVARFVHVSTEQVLSGSRPLVDVDETFEQPGGARGLYGESKARAEELVLAENDQALCTVAVRPRLIWGLGDTSVLPNIIAAIRQGRFAWIGGGRYLTSTCYVDNAVEALLLAADKGRGGEAYFATDGEPVVFREFVSELLETQGLEPPRLAVPSWLPPLLAAAGEWLWTWLPLSGQPPVTFVALYALGREVTVDDQKARRELGYRGCVSVTEGLARVRAAAHRPV
jgi:nucleoside-diphosphate-sugar epimerase